jgi:branched-chain amino acid transport system permease protein
MIAILILISPLIIALIATIYGSMYGIRFATNLLMWIALTESLNTISGYTGRLHFGHVMFFGVGAYVAGLLSLHLGIPWYVSVPFAPLTASIVALVIGYPTLRLHGAYFAIATWAFSEMLKQLSLNIEFLGKGYGIPLRVSVSDREVLYSMAIIAMVAIGINLIIERSRIGRALSAIRDNELVASSIGINTSQYKLFAYVMSSIPASLAGAVYVFWLQYIYGGDLFAGIKTDTMFMMLLLGGMGNYIGPLIGAVLFSGIYELLWSYIGEQLYLVLLGIFIMFIVVFMPYGISGLLGVRSVSIRYLLLSLSPRELRERIHVSQ